MYTYRFNPTLRLNLDADLFMYPPSSFFVQVAPHRQATREAVRGQGTRQGRLARGASGQVTDEPRSDWGAAETRSQRRLGAPRQSYPLPVPA